MDRDLEPWRGAVPDPAPIVESHTGWCPVPSKEGKVSGQNGQASVLRASCFPSSERTCEQLTLERADSRPVVINFAVPICRSGLLLVFERARPLCAQ